MKGALRYACVVGILFISTYDLPAPIEEETPSPSPTPTATATPSTSSSGTSPNALPRHEATRFAGTWTGKIKFGKAGEMEITLIVNAEANALIQKSRFGESGHVTTRTDSTLSWQTGVKNEISWTLTPAPGEQTALVTRRIGGTTTTATFRRVVQTDKMVTTPAPRRPHPRQKTNQ